MLGEYDTKQDPDCEDEVCAAPVQIIKPAHVFKHKEYNNMEFWNDIIVIKLEHEAELNGKKINFISCVLLKLPHFFLI